MPAAHEVQVPAPAAAQVPAPHCTQVDTAVAPRVADALPAAQGVHEVAEAPDQDPAPHCTGDAVTEGHSEPAGHAAHAAMEVPPEAVL